MLESHVTEWVDTAAVKITNGDADGAIAAIVNAIYHSELNPELTEVLRSVHAGLPAMYGSEINIIRSALEPLRLAAINAGPNRIARALHFD